MRCAMWSCGLVGGFLVTGCFNGPGFMKQKGAATLSSSSSEVEAPITNDSNGILTATLDAGSGATQVVQASASSGVAGSTISFPPGSLGISTNITVEEGATLAQSGIESELGITADQGLTAASSTLVISADAGIDASQPFTVAIVVDSGALRLDDDSRNFIVLYKVKKAASGELVAGIIPTSSLTFLDGKISFQTTYFGAFQVATVTKPIEAPVEVATTAPIVTKAVAEAAPLSIESVQPLVAKPGSTVTVRGKNIRPTIKLALANLRVDGVDVKSDAVATFMVPADVPFGFGDLVADQDGAQQRLKMFALADNSGLPLITLDPAGVCSGVAYIDANGTKQVGTKSCDGGASSLDRNGNGKIDAADGATMAEYSQGREGTSISSQATLPVPADGSFFTVTGSSTITRFATAPAGTRISLYFTGSPMIKHTTSSPKLILMRKADFKPEAGDVLEFVAVSDGWKELVRSSQSHTKFFAEMNNTGQTIPGETNTLIAWSNVTVDSQAEYDATSKRLTVREGGNFVVRYRPFLYISPNTDFKPSLTMRIKQNGVTVNSVLCNAGTDSVPADITCAETVHQVAANPGDYFEFELYYNHFGKKGNDGPSNGVFKGATGSYVKFERL